VAAAAEAERLTELAEVGHALVVNRVVARFVPQTIAFHSDEGSDVQRPTNRFANSGSRLARRVGRTHDAVRPAGYPFVVLGGAFSASPPHPPGWPARGLGSRGAAPDYFCTCGRATPTRRSRRHSSRCRASCCVWPASSRWTAPVGSHRVMTLPAIIKRADAGVSHPVSRECAAARMLQCPSPPPSPFLGCPYSVSRKTFSGSKTRLRGSVSLNSTVSKTN